MVKKCLCKQTFDATVIHKYYYDIALATRICVSKNNNNNISIATLSLQIEAHMCNKQNHTVNTISTKSVF